MTLPNNPERIERFIHELFHTIAKDEELMNIYRDLTAVIITRWEKYKDEYFDRKEK